MPRERRSQAHRYKSRPIVLMGFIRSVLPYRLLRSTQGSWFDDAAFPDVSSPTVDSCSTCSTSAPSPIRCRR
ncbi:hypothetical protein Y032_0357g3377 [Ancylostoma ceylanicum]|uniref:Uncharacterized protein n=1 Tax=Ancylostoma ceylanicum TaxID=53326 RepID=A0A016RX74_9BILA|nr:hypothetical protein Y032_0357g3377 [Ancylostoma ceylanicum]